MVYGIIEIYAIIFISDFCVKLINLLKARAGPFSKFVFMQ